MKTIKQIQSYLHEKLTPTQLEIIDESAKHIGHAGSQHGGHFAIKIASPLFEAQPLIACHRLVYDALQTLMQTHIHALRIMVIR